MAENIEDIRAHFKAFKPARQELARQLLVEVTESFLSAINNNEKLRPYLKEYPFPASRVKIFIGFVDQRYLPYSDGSIEELTLDENEITYFHSVDRPKKPDFEIVLSDTKILGKESYQEALEIVKENPQSTRTFNQLPFWDWVDAIFQSIINFFAYLFSIFQPA